MCAELVLITEPMSTADRREHQIRTDRRIRRPFQTRETYNNNNKIYYMDLSLVL